MKKIDLYDHPLSGNCYKVRLLLNQLNIKFNSIIIDVFKGQNREKFFKEINPAMKIPVLDDEGFVINESNAILIYLAEKYSSNFIPKALKERAELFSWLLYNKTSVDPFLAKARAIKKFFPSDKQNLSELALLQKEGHKALELIDKHLVNKNFFLTNYSIADISMYPYIKLSYEGEIELKNYKNILKWIENIEKTSDFVTIY